MASIRALCIPSPFIDAIVFTQSSISVSKFLSKSSIIGDSILNFTFVPSGNCFSKKDSTFFHIRFNCCLAVDDSHSKSSSKVSLNILYFGSFSIIAVKTPHNICPMGVVLLY